MNPQYTDEEWEPEQQIHVNILDAMTSEQKLAVQWYLCYIGDILVQDYEASTGEERSEYDVAYALELIQSDG